MNDERLDGTWRVTSCITDGEPYPEGCFLVYSFSRGLWDKHHPDYPPEYLDDARYIANAFVHPHQLTLWSPYLHDGPQMWRYRAIYRVSGDTLQWCEAQPWEDSDDADTPQRYQRPTEFVSTPDNLWTVYELERKTQFTAHNRDRLAPLDYNDGELVGDLGRRLPAG
jgi:uncharacterized protein (TIGR03067 family)